MIPKIIHYCWFGGNPLPESAKKCIASWKKFLPDYEIKEWNETNFDVNIVRYTAEAHRLKKYAYVSDYARMWILYNYGGLYFDTDVEIIHSLDVIIERGAFMGREAGPMDGENNMRVNPGLGIGAKKGMPFYKKVLDWYASHHYATWTGEFSGTIVDIVSKLFQDSSRLKLSNDITLSCDIYIYPPSFFCPINYFTGVRQIEKQTVSIHHYAATWLNINLPLHKRIINRLKISITRLTICILFSRFYLHNNRIVTQ